MEVDPDVSLAPCPIFRIMARIEIPNERYSRYTALTGNGKL
jgi:hypothetical protein